MKIDKNKLKDTDGKPLTQSLFLEIIYSKQYAVYTLKDEDYMYKGKLYPSLKRLYLEHEDPTEYDFANTYLIGWQHWQRLKRNKNIGPHIKEWAEELELKLRSQAIRDIIDSSADDKSFQASKWLADRGWDKRGAGRPGKQEAIHEERMQERIADEFKGDVVRMLKPKKRLGEC